MPSFEFEFGGFKQLNTSAEKEGDKIEPKYVSVAKTCPHCGRTFYEKTKMRRSKAPVGKLCKKVFEDD